MGEWIGENWQWLLALIPSVVIAWLAFRRYRIETADVSIQVRWDPDKTPSPPHFNQRGTKAEPFRVHLVAMNLGGTKSRRGTITVTADPKYKTCDSEEWHEDQPNAAMVGASGAHSCKLPRLGRNEKVTLPPLKIVPTTRKVEGGTRISHGKLRWEVWFGKRGGNADDLDFKLTVRRHPGQ